MTQTTFATFTDTEMAKKAAGALLDHGINADHISIVLPEGEETFYHSQETGLEMEREAAQGITTTTTADAMAGAKVGAEFGLTAGALATLVCIFIPGVGLVAGGGALAIALAGMVGTTAAGALAGGMTGYLKDQGVAEYDIETVGAVLQDGGAMISVFPADEHVTNTEVETIMAKYGGHISIAPNSITSVI